MDFLDVLRVLRRQWIVLLLGVILTGTGVVYALGTKTQYQASAEYLVLLPPAATGQRNPTNPYINLPQGLGFAASLIASEINTHEVAESLEDRGFTSDYTVALGPADGPALHLNVTGTDPTNVVKTRDEIIRLLDARLNAMQDIPGIPDSQLMYSQTKAADSEAVAVPGAKIKALVLVAAVGGVFTLLLALIMDGLRRARKKGPRAPDSDPGAEVDEAVRAVDREAARPVEAVTSQAATQPVAKDSDRLARRRRWHRPTTSKATAGREKTG